MEIKRVETKKELIDFIKVPWNIYRKDDNWVPPIVADQLLILNKQKNPFFKHAECELFVAYDKKSRPIGRIAAIKDDLLIKHKNKNIGLFGFFESIDDEELSRALFEKAEAWLLSKNIKSIMGPINLSIHNEVGLLIEGFNKPPVFMTSYNKPYYSKLIEANGYRKAKDLYSYWIDVYHKNFDKLFKIAERSERLGFYRIRNVSLKRIDEEIKKFIKIYNEAWKNNWGFIPITEEESEFMAKRLRPLVDEELIAFAEVNNTPIGVILAMPDYNFVFKKMGGSLFPLGIFKFLIYKRHIPWARVMVLGVLEEFRNRGIESALIAFVLKKGIRKGFYGAELSWTLEDNQAINKLIEKFGGVRYKTYRIYEKALS